MGGMLLMRPPRISGKPVREETLWTVRAAPARGPGLALAAAEGACDHARGRLVHTLVLHQLVVLDPDVGLLRVVVLQALELVALARVVQPHHLRAVRHVL